MWTFPAQRLDRGMLLSKGSGFLDSNGGESGRAIKAVSPAVILPRVMGLAQWISPANSAPIDAFRWNLPLAVVRIEQEVIM